jgi:hypothetical protein
LIYVLRVVITDIINSYGVVNWEMLPDVAHHG